MFSTRDVKFQIRSVEAFSENESEVQDIEHSRSYACNYYCTLNGMFPRFHLSLPRKVSGASWENYQNFYLFIYLKSHCDPQPYV